MKMKYDPDKFVVGGAIWGALSFGIITVLKLMTPINTNLDNLSSSFIFKVLMAPGHFASMSPFYNISYKLGFSGYIGGLYTIFGGIIALLTAIVAGVVLGGVGLVLVKWWSGN